MKIVDCVKLKERKALRKREEKGQRGNKEKQTGV